MFSNRIVFTCARVSAVKATSEGGRAQHPTQADSAVPNRATRLNRQTILPLPEPRLDLAVVIAISTPTLERTAGSSPLP